MTVLWPFMARCRVVPVSKKKKIERAWDVGPDDHDISMTAMKYEIDMYLRVLHWLHVTYGSRERESRNTEAGEPESIAKPPYGERVKDRPYYWG